MSRAVERPRTLFVINSLARGGAETQLLGVVQAAAEAGHDVRVATLLPGNDFRAQVEAIGVGLWSPDEGSGRAWSPRHLWRLAVRITRWRPHTTVSFLFQATLYMRVVNLVARPELSVSSMRNEKLESRLRSWLYRLTSRGDDVIVVNSRSARDTLQRAGTLPRSPRVRVIYNGVRGEEIRARVTRSRAETRALLGLRDDDVVFLGVGRLSAQKNWQSLVRALALGDDGRLRCLIAGTGEEHDSVARLADALGVADRVHLLGLRDDVPDLMVAADCVVLSSLYEGTPNVVLEALALGAPVIATDVGACAELLTRPRDTVVPADDHAALHQALTAFAQTASARTATPTQTRTQNQTPSRTQAQDQPAAPGGASHDPVADFGWPRIGGAWLDLMRASRT